MYILNEHMMLIFHVGRSVIPLLLSRRELERLEYGVESCLP